MSASRPSGELARPRSTKQSQLSGSESAESRARGRNRVELASSEEEEETDEEEEAEEAKEKKEDNRKESEQQVVGRREENKLAGERRKWSGKRQAERVEPADGRPAIGERVTRAASVAAGERPVDLRTQEAHQHQQQQQREQVAKPANKKVGLLEALLGERGRNWFEHRTVILDIQNGKAQKPARASDERHKEQVGEQANIQRQANLGQQEANNQTVSRRAELGDKVEETSELVSEKKVSPEQQETRHKKYSRLPTFGSIPQRLNALSLADTRRRRQSFDKEARTLPYFSYASHSASSASRATKLKEAPPGRQQSLAHARQRASDIERNSLASSSRLSNLSSSTNSSQLTTATTTTTSTSTSSNSSSAPLPVSARPSSRAEQQVPAHNYKQSHARTDSSGGRNSQLGFSNISNLFPGQPVRLRQRQREPLRAKSASLIDLAEERAQARRQQQLEQLLAGVAPAAEAAQAARLRQRRLAQQHQQARPASSMMRSRLNQRESSKSASNYANQYSQPLYQHRLRPASATGNYLSGSGAGARTRSPSTSYRLGSAGVSPLIDPDCPVHGLEQAPGQQHSQQMGLSSQRGRSYERDKRDELYAGSRYADYGHAPRNPSAAYYSLSQPDLVYAGAHDDHDHDDPYNIARPARDYPMYGVDRTPSSYAKHSPIYSPVEYDTSGSYAANSTPLGRANSRADRRPMSSAAAAAAASQRHQPGAYYNSASRFSLYHPEPEGGGLRSSLAPTSEQLRRILGYRPQPLAKPVHLHPQWAYTRPFIHLQPAGSGFGRSPSPQALGEQGEPLEWTEALKFAPFTRLQDSQAIRAVDFHPSGEVYAVGSNSRALRICAYPAEHELRHFEPFERSGEFGALGGLTGSADRSHEQLDESAELAAGNERHKQHQLRAQKHVKSPRVLFKFLQLHRGSIYCVSFNPSGQLLATGSNDQTVHLAKYNAVTHNPDGEEFRLTMHNGTVRDLCFIDDSSGNGSSLLLSAGGGDNKIYVTDCDTVTPFQSMAGHTQMVMALNHCGGAQFVSGSYDKTIRFWDLRARSCTSIVSAPPAPLAAGSGGGAGGGTFGGAGLTSGPGAAVCALRVDPSGRLLASGHTDTTCMLYDIRGGKIIQTFRPHDDEIRAISFSPKSYYLLTGGYDGRLVVSDLQGDLTQPLPSVCVAESQDKIVQAKWHPADFTFVSTSADKSATLWSLPGEIRN